MSLYAKALEFTSKSRFVICVLGCAFLNNPSAAQDSQSPAAQAQNVSDRPQESAQNNTPINQALSGEPVASGSPTNVASGPLPERRKAILAVITKLGTLGIGTSNLLSKFKAVEDLVRAGKSEQEIKPQLDALTIDLREQMAKNPSPALDQARKEAITRAKNAAIKANMHAWQVAAESYAVDSGGIYPGDWRAMLPYMPGGDSKINGRPGVGPPNSLTGIKGEALYDAGLTKGAQLQAAGNPLKPGKPGQVGYSVVDEGANYAIVGTDVDGNSVRGHNGAPLVLSNQYFSN